MMMLCVVLVYRRGQRRRQLTVPTDCTVPQQLLLIMSAPNAGRRGTGPPTAGASDGGMWHSSSQPPAARRPPLQPRAFLFTLATTVRRPVEHRLPVTLLCSAAQRRHAAAENRPSRTHVGPMHNTPIRQSASPLCPCRVTHRPVSTLAPTSGTRFWHLPSPQARSTHRSSLQGSKARVTNPESVTIRRHGSRTWPFY